MRPTRSRRCAMWRPGTASRAAALLVLFAIAAAVAVTHMDNTLAFIVIAPGYLVQAWLFETHRALGGLGYPGTMGGVAALVWALIMLGLVGLSGDDGRGVRSRVDADQPRLDRDVSAAATLKPAGSGRSIVPAPDRVRGPKRSCWRVQRPTAPCSSGCFSSSSRDASCNRSEKRRVG